MLRQASRDSETPRWKLRALRVGRSLLGLPGAVLLDGGSWHAREPMAYLFWLVQDPEEGGAVVLVDCGFTSTRCAEAFGIEAFVSPDELVRRCGVEPEAVTDVVLTHLHWDHCGGMACFPRATLWVSARELAWARASRRDSGGERSSRRWMASMGLGDVGPELGPEGLAPADLDLLEAAAAAGRVRELRFDAAEAQCVRPGIFVLDARGAHTPGSVLVACASSSEVWVFASDAAMLRENLAQSERATGCHDCYCANIRALRRAKEFATSDRHVLPGHDLRIERMPQLAPGVFKVQAE